MFQNIRNKIVISIAIAAIIYLGFTIYADYEKVLLSFSKFNWLLLPVLLVLSLGNYVTRFVKWEYYLKIIEVKLHKIDSFSIFMSGLVTVSYTHLRAHETVLDLVCRLLLEKKKSKKTKKKI